MNAHKTESSDSELLGCDFELIDWSATEEFIGGINRTPIRPRAAPALWAEQQRLDVLPMTVGKQNLTTHRNPLSLPGAFYPEEPGLDVSGEAGPSQCLRSASTCAGA